jgi:hypothetical protein
VSICGEGYAQLKVNGIAGVPTGTQLERIRMAAYKRSELGATLAAALADSYASSV